jgi:hypothetical protein
LRASAGHWFCEESLEESFIEIRIMNVVLTVDIFFHPRLRLQKFKASEKSFPRKKNRF